MSRGPAGALAVLATAWLACGSPAPAAQQIPADAAPVATPAPAAPAMPPLGMIGALMASGASQPGPYDEPRKSAGFDDDEDHGVIVELDSPVVELRTLSWMGGGGVELRALTERLAALARKKHVTALVLRFGATDLELPAAEELRAAMMRFRSTKPPRAIHCHTDSAADAVYFAMTACDSIGLSPGGQVVVTGAAATPIHVKGALDRLGIQADFLHVGAFKGAAEPLTRDRPSPEMMSTLGAILDERHATITAGIAQGRRLEPARVRALIDVAVFQDADALAAGLVDQVASFDSFRDHRLAGAGWTTSPIDDDEDAPPMARLMQLLGTSPPPRPSGPHIALVYAVGNVVDGKGGGQVGARREIAPRTLGAALRFLAGDESVVAVVLRIDSGGGSALASESLWQTVAELKKKKPVVVSMGSVAASGGYYIACGADAVYASRTTLTGSIGVVGGKLAIGRGLARLGITAHPIGRGKRALMWSALAPWSRDERSAVQDLMEGVYRTFVARVIEGRKKSAAEVQAVAQGRVWTGAAALQHGLVDHIGGLEDALADARKRAKMDDDSAPIEVLPPPPSLMDLLGDLGVSALPFGLDRAAVEAAQVLGPREAATLARLFGQLAGFRDSPVQAAMLLPIAY